MNESENVTVVDGYTLASPYERIFAILIDLIVYGVLGYILSLILGVIGCAWLGQLAALGYLIFRDNLKPLNYQSIGKKVMKLKVIRSNDKMTLDFMEAVKRNFIFLPNVLGVIGLDFFYTMGILTAILIIIEVYILFTSTDSQRLGDQYADTIVIENPLS